MLPVPYFHLVSTLPHALNGLIAVAPRLIYELLFNAVSATLTEFAASPHHLGGVSAFSLVLHTWKQDLGRHVHLHALVAGGALTESGTWVMPKKGFLFPVKALSKVFRGKFITGLDALRRAGRWPETVNWQRLKPCLYAHDWVVYAKQPLGGAEAVLEYLGRYTHRVAISNERIVGIDRSEVVFRVRGDPLSGRKRVVRLPGVEFIGRFVQHVLPVRLQAYPALWIALSSTQEGGLEAARAALGVLSPQAAVIESVTDFLRRLAHIEQELPALWYRPVPSRYAAA